MPVVETMVGQYLASDGFKQAKSLGESFLGSLTGCRVKPKGTPFSEVYSRAPKLFYIYGEGQIGGKGFRPSAKSGGAVYDPVTGAWISNADIAFPLSDRKAIEASLRKQCESVTGDLAFYIEVRPPYDDRGVIKLNDGRLYDAKAYQVEGGTLSQPVYLNNPPKSGGRPSGQAEVKQAQPLQAGFGSVGLFVVAGLAAKKFGWL